MGAGAGSGEVEAGGVFCRWGFNLLIVIASLGELSSCFSSGSCAAEKGALGGIFGE